MPKVKFKSTSAAEVVRQNIRALMLNGGWNETETARRLKDIHRRWNQPRFHRMMSGEQDFSLIDGDFDDIASLFDVSVAELFEKGGA